MQQLNALEISSNYTDYSLEDGTFNLVGLSNFYTGFVSRVSAIFNGKKLIPITFGQSDLQKAVDIIKKYSPTALEHFAIVAPEYIDGKLVPYVDTLNDVLDELSGIENNLLKPLEQWAANMVTDPEYGEKAWTSIPNKTTNIDKHTDELKKYFNESVGDGVANRLFNNTYVDSKGLELVSSGIEKLSSKSMHLLDGKLTNRADNISMLIRKLTSEENVANKVNSIPPQKLKSIVNLVLQTAKELELLSIVLFQIKTLSYSNTETIKKIINQLK